MKLILQDHVSREALLAAFFLNCALLVFITIILGNLPSVAPLFYSRPWGEEQLVSRLVLFMAPLASLAFLIGNLALAKSLVPEWFLKETKNQKGESLLVLRILSFITLISALLSSITVLRIALIVA